MSIVLGVGHILTDERNLHFHELQLDVGALKRLTVSYMKG